MTFWERMQAVTDSNGFWIGVAGAGWAVVRWAFLLKARVDTLEKSQGEMRDNIRDIHNYLLNEKD